MSREEYAPLVFSLVLHAGFAVLFLVGFSFTSELTVATSGPAVESIQARIVTAAELERAIQARDQEIARARQAVLDQQRREREQRAAAQRERDRRAEREQQRLSDARQAEDRARREAEALEARRETERLAAEAQARQDAARRQLESETELRERMDAEEQYRDAEKKGLVDEYRTSIEQKVTRNWLPPQNLPDDINCVVRAGQIPGGVVVNVQVISCNGDDLLVRSIEAAVWKASPLPEPPDASVFDRTIEFVFNPRED